MPSFLTPVLQFLTSRGIGVNLEICLRGEIGGFWYIEGDIAYNELIKKLHTRSLDIVFFGDSISQLAMKVYN